jgi:hypothetical protein
VDPERMKAIILIALSNRKRSMQSFFGKINLVRRFVSDFAKIVKPLQQMIKKDVHFKWTSIEKEAFDKAKGAIAITPTLQSPYFSKNFCCTHLLQSIPL